ncbi:hypothetical protein ACFLQW_00210 [Candidatus Zixiibacteriota bacterium]
MNIWLVILLGVVFLFLSIQLMRNKTKATNAATVGVFALALVLLIHVDPKEITKATLGPIAYERVLDDKLDEAKDILHQIRQLEERISTASDSIEAISIEIKEIAQILAAFTLGDLAAQIVYVTDEGLDFYTNSLTKLLTLSPIDSSSIIYELIDELEKGRDTALAKNLRDTLRVLNQAR